MTFDLDQHRLARARTFERENRMLAAERRRLERLLAEAVRELAAEPGPFVLLDADGELGDAAAPTPLEILEGLAQRLGMNLARPAWVEEQELAAKREQWRQEREAGERFLAALRELQAA